MYSICCRRLGRKTTWHQIPTRLYVVQRLKLNANWQPVSCPYALLVVLWMSVSGCNYMMRVAAAAVEKRVGDRCRAVSCLTSLSDWHCPLHCCHYPNGSCAVLTAGRQLTCITALGLLPETTGCVHSEPIVTPLRVQQSIASCYYCV